MPHNVCKREMLAIVCATAEAVRNMSLFLRWRHKLLCIVRPQSFRMRICLRDKVTNESLPSSVLKSLYASCQATRERTTEKKSALPPPPPSPHLPPQDRTFRSSYNFFLDVPRCYLNKTLFNGFFCSFGSLDWLSEYLTHLKGCAVSRFVYFSFHFNVLFSCFFLFIFSSKMIALSTEYNANPVALQLMVKNHCNA